MVTQTSNVKLIEGMIVAGETLGGEVVFFSISGITSPNVPQTQLTPNLNVLRFDIEEIRTRSLLEHVLLVLRPAVWSDFRGAVTVVDISRGVGFPRTNLRSDLHHNSGVC